VEAEIAAERLAGLRRSRIEAEMEAERLEKEDAARRARIEAVEIIARG
jgi:hypothetical protein